RFLDRFRLHRRVHRPEASLELDRRLGPACLHELDGLGETRDVGRRVDAERRERPLLSAGTDTDVEPSIAELVEGTQALRQMYRVVERQDIERAAEPDVLSTRGGKRHRLRRPELREASKHLLLGPDALETERFGTAEERTKRRRVEGAI